MSYFKKKIDGVFEIPMKEPELGSLKKEMGLDKNPMFNNFSAEYIEEDTKGKVDASSNSK